MQKTVLDEVYDLLKNIGAVDNESEFSTDWLARSECYMRTLRFKQANPSVGTLAICASKLQHYASFMTLKNSHNELSQRFTQLSNQCHQQINAQSQSGWVHQMTACSTRTAPSRDKCRCHARTVGPGPGEAIRYIGHTSSPSGG